MPAEWRRQVQKLAVFALALCCAGITIYAYFPGSMSSDSVQMLWQARNGVPNNTYSPMMSYIWRVTDRVISGPGGLLILHDAVFWLALALVASQAVRSAWLQCLMVLLCGFWLPTFAMEGILWKDVGMRTWLLAATGLLMLAHTKRRLWPLAGAALFLFLACGYRHNGAVAALPLLCWMVYLTIEIRHWPRRWYHYAGGLVAAWMITVTAAGLVNSAGVKDTRLWSYAMVHDLAGISVRTGADALPAFLREPQGLTVEKLKRMYSPLHANSLLRPETRTLLGVPDPLPDVALKYELTPETAGELVLAWLRSIAAHPAAYLDHRMTMTRALLVIPPAKPWYPFLTSTEPNPWGYYLLPNRLNRAILSEAVDVAFGTHWFDAWIYYLLLIACGVGSVLVRSRWSFLVRILVVSSLLYYASLFVFGMAPDYRYNIWALTCSYLAPFLLLARDGTGDWNTIGRSENLP
jgi:hypothetical protein